MNRDEEGFTLIELVVVIVILGILAAVALPKFIDLRTDAALAATQGVAGALASGGAINYAGRMANTTANTIAITNCTDVVKLLVGGVMPDGYTIATNALDTTALGSGLTRACTVNGGNSQTANFTAIGS